ncbi:hypothetical protein CLOP_g1924 [Closterium sp. NIES-67]|nr:hypothetical protein CLOP_g24705 [Closterium sp. NIES-67]GJP71058.1 hypothetical protein CLOP_g1924 [Closterium sp. NIES-67]
MSHRRGSLTSLGRRLSAFTSNAFGRRLGSRRDSESIRNYHCRSEYPIHSNSDYDPYDDLSDSESSHSAESAAPDIIPSTLLAPSFAPSASQFCEVASAFQTGFGGTLPRIPGDIVEKIVERADYKVRDITVQRERMSGGDWEETYVVSQPVDFGKGWIKEIKVDAEAHDQGWSSYPEDHNTYDNSWTYAELIRILPDGSFASPREQIYRNLHADRHWQHHSKSWTAQSLFVQSLNAGDKVAVVLRAQYPGWVHYVKWARVEIVYSTPLL